MNTLSYGGEIKHDGLSFADLNGQVCGIIKNIQVPNMYQGKGWGAKIIDAWEKTLAQNGISYAVATNIGGEEAKDFWEHRGYKTPRELQGKHIPYCMYKQLQPLSPTLG